MDPKIVFEDSHILVLAKPAGMVVNRVKTARGKTVQDWVEEKLKCQNSNVETTTQNSKLSDFYQRAGIVHRLDKETSGLLLVAKTPSAFAHLQAQFKERKVRKKYLTLVHGEVKAKEGEIEAPIGRLPWKRMRFGVLPGGKQAKTKYQVLCIKYYVSEKERREYYSLLEAFPHTGRTHQIRVHLQYINHPVVADEFYVGKKRARKDRQWCPRLFLHACYLNFCHPKTKKRVEFELELPEDLKKVLESLSDGLPSS